MSTEAAIQRGRGLIANPAFFMIFLIAGAMGIAGVLSIGVSGMWGWGLAAVTAILFGVAWITGLGERLFVGLLALGGLASGVLSVLVVWHLWGPTQGEHVWAALIALILLALAPAAIAGERILPLFVAFVAGIWGIVSVIVFVMVVSGLGMEAH